MTKYTSESAGEIALYAQQFGRAAAREHFTLTVGQLGGLLYRYFKANHRSKFDIKISSDKPLIIKGDAMIIGDVHVPCTDWDLAWRMMEVAERWMQEPRTLIVAGDLFNLDWASVYPKIVELPGWKQEKAAARALFEEWLTLFDRIVVFAGNHDRRAAKITEGNLDIADLVKLVNDDKRVMVSDWGHCILRSGKREYRVTHGRNYSVNTGVVGNELSHKFEQHIIMHHQHHASISLDRFKRRIVIDNPALVDQKKLAYVTKDDSKSPNMARGFTMIIDGEPTMFVEGITVWNHWLGEAQPAVRKLARAA